MPTLTKRLLILGLAVILSGCSIKNTPTLSLSNNQTSNPGDTSAVKDNTLLSVDAPSLSSAFTKELDQATALAKVDHVNAELFAFTVEFPTDLSRGQSKRVYVYGSESSPKEWFIVAINEITGERIRSKVPKEDYLGPTLTSIPFEFWKLNPIEVLQIADKTGGKTFRTENPGSEITASLSHTGPNGWLWWVVEYRGLNNKTLAVRIHPKTGEIYDENGQIVTSASTSPTSSNNAS